MTSVLFGIIPPSKALKYGTQSSAALLKDRKYEQKSYQRSGIYHAVEEIFINHPAGLPPILDLLAGNECVKTSDNKSKDNRNLNTIKSTTGIIGEIKEIPGALSPLLFFFTGTVAAQVCTFFCLDSTNTITIINAT